MPTKMKNRRMSLDKMIEKDNLHERGAERRMAEHRSSPGFDLTQICVQTAPKKGTIN